MGFYCVLSLALRQRETHLVCLSCSAESATEALFLALHSVSMRNTAVGIKNCKQLFSSRLAFTTQEKTAKHTAEMMSVLCVAIFWVINVISGEKSCSQFLILTESGAGVSHRIKSMWNTMRCKRDNFSGALGGARETHRERVSHALKRRLNTDTLRMIFLRTELTER